MNEEIYFKQYRQLNTKATDYIVLDIKEPFLDFNDKVTVLRTIDEYERNNEEIPIVGEYAVLVNSKEIPVAVSVIEKVNVEIPNVLITVKVIFV